jgi:hypothetical protein
MAVRTLAQNVLTNRQRVVAGRALLKLRALRKSDLDALAQLAGTDKSSREHDYTRLYRRYLDSRRTEVRSVLEIGVGGVTSISGYETLTGGQSLRVWSDYFPNAQITRIDIHDKNVSGPRIHFERGDQSDPVFLQSVIDKHGPFDVVIDDGSHIGRHIIASFNVLWKAVRPGGFYIVEDLALAYHPDWEGGPPGTPGTAAELLKTKIDDTLRRYQDPFQPSIESMHIYGEICFFEKAAR